MPGHYEIIVPISVAITTSPAVPTPPRTYVQKDQCKRTRDCGPTCLLKAVWSLTVPSPEGNPLSATSWVVIGQRMGGSMKSSRFQPGHDAVL